MTTIAYSISSFNKSPLLTSAYADDLQLVTRISEENQALLNNTNKQWKLDPTNAGR